MFVLNRKQHHLDFMDLLIYLLKKRKNQFFSEEDQNDGAEPPVGSDPAAVLPERYLK